MLFELPSLEFTYEALEPYFDSKTMQIHHSKHHAAYTNNLNSAIEGTELEGKDIVSILKRPNLSIALRNNGGGFYNHSLFWEILSPEGGGSPTGELLEAINKQYGSFDTFKEAFKNQQ